MPYVPPANELAQRKKRYYREKRPDLDPQSTTSRVMEFFGADEPYREDSGSYDYRAKKAEADPTDASWMIPLLSDEGADRLVSAPGDTIETIAGIAGGDEHGRRDDAGFASSVLREQLGREPTEDEIAGAIEAIRDDTVARENMASSLGRDPNEEEWAQWKQLTTDPRSTSERNAGAILNFLDPPLLGAADEVTAGAMSLTGRGSYDDELALSRKIKRGYEENEPGLGARNIASTAGGIGALFTGPAAASFHVADAGWRGGRALLGMALKAATRAGKAAGAVLPGGAAGATDFAGLGFNEGEGGFKKRLDNVSPTDVAAGAIGGGLLFPAMGAAGAAGARGARAVGSQAKRIGQTVAKRLTRGDGRSAKAGVDDIHPVGPKPPVPRKLEPKPPPRDPGDGSVRDALEAAFKKQTKKARRS